MKKYAVAGLLLLSVTLCAEPLKVLTVGNAFTDSAFVYLPSIAETAGGEPDREQSIPSGCIIQRRRTLAQAAGRQIWRCRFNESPPAKRSISAGAMFENLSAAYSTDAAFLHTAAKAALNGVNKRT